MQIRFSYYRPRVSAVAALCALHVASATSYALDKPVVFDDRYATACGPIACYVALRALDSDVSLSQAIEACQWTKGETVGLHDLHTYLQDVPGVIAEPARLSPTELRDWLANGEGVAILATRKHSPEINHAVAAIAAGKDGIAIVDYPDISRMPQQLADLSDNWDGAAILVSRRDAAFATVIRQMPVSSAAGVACVGWIMFSSVGRRRAFRRALAEDQMKGAKSDGS